RGLGGGRERPGGAPRRVHGQGVRLRRVSQGLVDRDPAPRRQRLHVGARPAPVFQARQVVGVHLRRRDVSPRAGRGAHQSVTGHEHPGFITRACTGGAEAREPAVAARIEGCRKALMAGEAPFAELLAREGWDSDLSGLRYLSHFITPRSSPIRFTARFFLCRVPADQEPRLFTEETSEGFWIHPGHGYRRFLAGEMKMAEP